MINQNLHPIYSDRKQPNFGARLRKTREAMGLERKEAASQLFLNEKMIMMLESGEIDQTLPLTFVRGYIRNYSKLLGIPEHEVKIALEALQPKPVQEDVQPANPLPLSGTTDSDSQIAAFNLSHFFVQLITYLLAITIFGLSAIWWYTKQAPEVTVTNSQQTQNTAAANSHPQPPTSASNPFSTSRAMDPSDASRGTVTTNQASNKPAEAVKPKVVQQPVQVKKSPVITYRHDKQLLSDWVMPNHFLQQLIDLSLFIVILAAGMRLYGRFAQPARMASARLVRTPGQPNQARYAARKRPIIKNTLNYINTHRSMLFFGLIITVSVVGLVDAIWIKFSDTTQTTTVVAEQKPAIQPPKQLVIQDVTLPTLPNAQLKPALLASLPRYATQQFKASLQELIAQAAAVKFALTDKSSPLSKFKSKKTSRKHRPAYLNYDNNYDTENYNRPSYPVTQ